LLSRFITAQKTAFRKLLKKYKKWTGRDFLEVRWQAEVTSRPDSFTSYDLAPFLDHWADLLQEIRAAMGVGQGRSGSSSVTQSPAIQPMAPTQSSIAVSRQIHQVVTTANDVDFDAVIASAPVGKDGARAVYWVHPEQLLELQVLLLQHTRMAFPRSPPSTSSGSTPVPTVVRRSSIPVSRRDSVDREAPVGIIIIDDAEEYSRMQNSQPISNTEESYTVPPSTAAVTLRWTAASELAVCLKSDMSSSPENDFRLPARIKAKHLNSFLNLGSPFTIKSTNGSESPDGPAFPSANEERLTASRDWLCEHRQVQPLVGISSQRSRFTSLPHSRDAGQWCILDSDIKMKKISMDDLDGRDWPQRLSQGAVSFPYAVLSVRQEGKTKVDLIKILDESHLVRDINHFAFTILTEVDRKSQRFLTGCSCSMEYSSTKRNDTAILG